MSESTVKPAQEVSSLESLRAAMKETPKVDLATLPRFTFADLGLTLCIGPMSAKSYYAVEYPEQFYPPNHQLAGQKSSDVKLDEFNRDKALLSGSLLDSDGKRLAEAEAVWLLNNAPGVEIRQCIDEIQKLNPPRPLLRFDLQGAVAISRMTVLLYRLLKKAGKLQELRDYILLPDPSAPEAQALVQDLQKWEDAVLGFEPLMEIEEAAHYYGIGVYDRAQATE